MSTDVATPTAAAASAQELVKIYGKDETEVRALDGVTIDYVLGMQGAGFKFVNPRAVGTCGCGSSFSV